MGSIDLKPPGQQRAEARGGGRNSMSPTCHGDIHPSLARGFGTPRKETRSKPFVKLYVA